ncbi:fused DSP-PTPase phosphatase/NAD kinase-like protein [Thioclava atlantica]|uniref:Beta-lactamase hydrolase-family protein n=1 Tax=Thioclava atlantica TaxID=1317124 RepID=A0A085U071_9RHOB|nr:protein tyrosine phosphatase family protein [Thioclava atlantica]KFE36368.1 beta-lactamase hydrolase-family protein [Thioclava atlantica]
MKTKKRKSLLRAAMVPVTAVAMSAAVPAASRAQATNPCAPAAVVNPCAPAAMPANPCAPSAAPATTAEAAPMAKGPYDTTVKATQAPYGDKMPPIVDNYLRATPYVGTGGFIDPTGIPMLKQLGFKTVVSLLKPDEGAPNEGDLVKKSGMNYIQISVPTKAPTAEQVAEFAKIVEDPANYPILLHCESSNRVGAMWALYRASKGVPPEIAVEEGRQIGLKTSREPAVREQLGMAPL